MTKGIANWASHPLPGEKTVYEAQILDELEPLVFQARREIFGSPAPKFSTMEQAEQWAEGLRIQFFDRPECQAEQSEARSLRQKAEELLRRIGKLERRPLTIEPRDGEALGISTRFSPILQALAGQVGRIAGYSAFPAEQIEAYILTGRRPHLPALSVSLDFRGFPRLPAVEGSNYRSVTFTVHCRQVSDELLGRMGEYARQALQVSRRPPDSALSPRQRTLRRAFKAVYARMGRPKRKPAKFWRLVQKEMEAAGEEPIRPESLRHAWWRFSKSHPEQAAISEG